MYEGKGIYRHYKGGLYDVLGVAMEEATLLPVVIYSPIDERPEFMKGFDATMWTRPLDDFNAEVLAPVDHAEAQFAEPDKLPPMLSDNNPVPRFVKLSMTEILASRNERLTEWARFQIGQGDY